MTLMHHLTDSEIGRYAKKIFGFAMRKTGNHHQAEDLTQDIMLALLKSLQPGREIGSMDAWVHTICCYTWSNYLSREKRHWQTSDIDGLQLEDAASGPEEQHVQREILDRMKREMAFLNRLHRTISVMYYYDNRSVTAISEQLHIPQGTVKWHLYEARNKVKEAMSLEQGTSTLSLKPVRLWIGHSGSPGPGGEPGNYFGSLLSHNIAVAAYRQPATIEEIARSLGVSCAYVEDCIHKFEYAGLLRKIGKDKYQTDFIIGDMSSNIAQAAYLKAKAPALAEKLYEAVHARLGDWKAIGFHGSGCSDAFLLWAFVPYAVNYQYNRVKDREYYARYGPVERKDGGKYTVQARIRYEEQEYQASIPDYERVRQYASNGIKSRSTGKYFALQMDSWWSGRKWRDFNAPDIVDMHHVIRLMESGAAHSEYDKERITRMVKKGFVSYKDETLACLIPFFKADQYTAFIGILEQLLQEAGARADLEQVHDDFIALWKSFAPAHISSKDIVTKAISDGTAIVFAVMEYLVHKELLPLPSEEEQERLTTLMWMSGEA
ncbi:hypothetical protein PAESOLCIP111_01709 [Paenibacillus solanacearum]|uniref:RNA polymerase sigma-70 region 2 domain-containing protein n=1 Tax=Paenibacillus solanacearum TaxID=2048548 RepID=A0A916NHH9_9BACL|nr:sigma-70 family RNA polymerase sigma factor [Paenibacillus solanacearum]CAG7614441.1 hypothetical protein PAESOLCIP111_01709 [Paenibacillus solanacearum]